MISSFRDSPSYHAAYRVANDNKDSDTTNQVTKIKDSDGETLGFPHDIAPILTIAVCLAFAFVGDFIAVRLQLPPLVGYLLAGVAVDRCS